MGTTMIRKKYCGTAAKASGNRENKPHPGIMGVPYLLERNRSVFLRGIVVVATAFVLVNGTVVAGDGRGLEARYAEQRDALRKEIVEALPIVSMQKVADYEKARASVKERRAELETAKKELGRVATAKELVHHAKKWWIGGAEKGIAEAEAMLKDATTDAERKAAKDKLAAMKASRQDGFDALKERQAKLDAALAREPVLLKNVEAAKANLDKALAATLSALGRIGKGSFLASDKLTAYANAIQAEKQVQEGVEKLAAKRAATQTALDELAVGAFLKSDALDDKMVKYIVLYEAIPAGLAEFAGQGTAQGKLVDQLLDDPALMMEMVKADGARGGKYGQAMKIYTDIRKASGKAKSGILQKLALAVALQHAQPVVQRNAVALEDGPEFVDPVKRYLSYEKAYLAGELDAAFKGLDVWELRMVIYGSEPDETSAWGREMLRSYRPDHIANPDYRWRYVAAVRTEIKYRDGYGKVDKPEYQHYQNILMNGGVCGRRAFFGRFMLRAFGIPTTARPQPGHAALAHWTPDGWVVNLGGRWGVGWTDTRYDRDLDFLATTQAREDEDGFMMVKRAQWIGDLFNEKRVFGLHSGIPGFWYGLSLYIQRGIIDDLKAETLAAVGEELGEANESNVKYEQVETEVTDADRKIVTDLKTGAITIPAAACSTPAKSTRKIVFMPSNLGGKQLHYNRNGLPEAFEYTIDVKVGGAYTLTARVITPTPDQYLRLAVNSAREPIDIAMPFTVGLWGASEPVEISLSEGKNVLTFSRFGDDIRGLTIRDFTLSPTN